MVVPKPARAKARVEVFRYGTMKSTPLSDEHALAMDRTSGALGFRV